MPFKPNSGGLFYVYTASLTNIASGSQSTANIQITTDADFLLMQILACTSLSAANTTANGATLNVANSGNNFAENNFALQITDLGSGINLTSAAVKQSIICGNAFNSTLLENPMTITAGSNILLTVTNLVGTYTAGQSAATLAGVDISLVGYKVNN